MQNKERAGDERRWTWKKKSGLSMEYKSGSKSFAASFHKSEDEDVVYETEDKQSPETPFMNDLNDGETKSGAQPTFQQDISTSEGKDNLDSGQMDSLKNTSMRVGGRVADISSKTNWMKDKVANFWSKKGKEEDSDNLDVGKVRNEIPKEEHGSGNVSDVSQSSTHDNLSNIEDKTSFNSESQSETSTLEGTFSISEPGSSERKEDIKDKKPTKAKSGWIRDQVSNLIAKGKGYASSSSQVEKDITSSDIDSKLSDAKNLAGRGKDKEKNVRLSMTEHYNLKQKETEDTPESLQDAQTNIVIATEPVKMVEEVAEKQVFAEIHESMNKQLTLQTTASLKEDSRNSDTDDRPVSPLIPTPKNAGSKKVTTKLKGFLQPRPLTTDLTHLPPPLADNREKQESPQSNKATAKKKFKLSFSELLHSQENARKSEDESRGTENAYSPSPSPSAFNRIEEEMSVSEDDEASPLTSEIESKYESSAHDSSSATFLRLWIMALLLYAFFLLPTSWFIDGLVFGILVTYLCGCLIIWLFCPSGKSIEQYKQEIKQYIKEQEFSTPLKKPGRSIDPKLLQKPRDLKGWVHFLVEYEPRSFSLDMTKDVLAVLKGEVLHILYCKPPPEGMQATPHKIKKRGLRKRRKKNTSLQQNQEPVFVFEEEHKIMLPLCQIKLCPLDLPMRRIWNRKYPIRIDVPADAILKRQIDVPFEELTANFDDFFDNNKTAGSWKTCTNDESFHIFPNTSREKEDWFYRMQLCIKALKHQKTFQDIRNGNLSSRPSESYPHYMTECIHDSEKVTSRMVNGKKLEPHSAWLNVLLGRAFWDVWHEPYWKRKVWLKIQNRLSKLNTPPIIKEIFVKDLHLGHTLPIIHRGSLPELDEYGVWTDLQVTYHGEFTLTLETQLNVDYYVALLTKIAKQQTQTTDVRMKVVREKNEDELTESGEIFDASASDQTDFEGDATTLDEQFPEIFLEAMDNVAVDEEDLGAVLDDDPMTSDPRTKAFLESKTGKRVVGIIGWLARSKIAKRVAETDFAKRAYEKAYEKFRKMPILLKVTVQSLKGTLAVNIPPPPSNRLWFGFRGNPAILLTAQPKLGERHVRLTYLTDWIEKKLKEEFKKLFVLPSMQDISVKLMYSRLEELYPDRPLS